jgi:hypothetical protein
MKPLGLSKMLSILEDEGTYDCQPRLKIQTLVLWSNKPLFFNAQNTNMITQWLQKSQNNYMKIAIKVYLGLYGSCLITSNLQQILHWKASQSDAEKTVISLSL